MKQFSSFFKHLCGAVTLILVSLLVFCGCRNATKKNLELSLSGAVNGVVTVTYVGEPVTVTATSAPEKDLVIVYEGKDGTEYEASETAPTDAGTYRVEISFAGDAEYEATSLSAELKILKAALNLGIEAKTEYGFGEEIVPSVTGNAGGGTVTYVYEGTGETEYPASATAPTAVGTYKVTATVAETKNYLGGSASAEFSIENLVITVAGATDGVVTVAYNGKPAELTITSSPEKELTVVYAGKGETAYPESGTPPTEIGTYTVTVSFAGDDMHQAVSITVELKIVLDQYPAPETPTLVSRDHDSITVDAKSGEEYRLGEDGEWNTTGVFENLEFNTEYRIYARKAGEDAKPSEPSEALTVKTLDAKVGSRFDSDLEKTPVFSDMPFALSTERAHSGDTSIKSKPTANAAEQWLFMYTSVVHSQMTYEENTNIYGYDAVSFWLYSTAESETFTFQMQVLDWDWGWAGFAPSHTVPANQWVKVTVNFFDDINAGTKTVKEVLERFLAYRIYTTESAPFYVDDVILVKMEFEEYTATFKAGETVVDTVNFTVKDKTLAEPAVPEKAGYTGAWEAYVLSEENLTIQAVYTPIEYTITYENTEGASNSNPVKYTIESETIALGALSREGYTFEGWYNGETPVTAIEKGSFGNVTLTAKWKAIFKITVAGAQNGALSATYCGEPVTVTATAFPEKELTVTYEGAGDTEYEASEIAPTNAGTYTVTVSFAGDEDYEATSVTIELTIEKAGLDLGIEMKTQYSKGEEIAPNVTGNAGDGTVAFLYEGTGDTEYEASETAPAEKGTYRVTATVAETANYLDGSASFEFSIVDLAITVENATDGTVTVTYNGEPATVTANVVPEKEITITYEGKGDTDYEASETAPVNAGTYTVTVSFAGDEEFEATSVTVELIVKKAVPDLAIEMKAIYGFGKEIVPAITGNTGGGAVTYTYEGTGDTQYAASETVPTAVGTYKVTAVVAETANYLGGSATFEFAIEKVVITVSDAEDGVITVPYTGEPAAITVHATPEKELTVTYEGKDGTDYEKSETAPTESGSYLVTITFAGDEDYEAASLTVELEILASQYPVPEAPVLVNRDHDSIAVEIKSGEEYRLGEDGEWNPTGVFENLAFNTEYRVYARRTGALAQPSEPSEALTVKTFDAAVGSRFDSDGEKSSITDIPFTLSTEQSHSGDTSLKSKSAAGENWLSMYTAQVNSQLPLATQTNISAYDRLSFWIYATGDQTSFTFYMQLMDLSWGWVEFAQNYTVPTNQWVKVNVDFFGETGRGSGLTVETALSSFLAYRIYTTEAAPFYLDDLILVKMEFEEYTATFEAGGSVVDTLTFTVKDKTLTEPAVPEKAGYTGVWEAYTLSAGDLTIHAVYTPIEYTISYENTKGRKTPTRLRLRSKAIRLRSVRFLRKGIRSKVGTTAKRP